MPNALKALISLIAVSAAAACQRDASDQNIIIDNNVVANADIEALPPDESSATPTDELANGVNSNDTASNEVENSL